MFLKGFSVNNFRSIGGTGIILDDLQKISVFIGKNNAGKTNILRFLDFVGKNEIRSGKVGSPLGEYDYHRLDKENTLEFTLKFDVHPESDIARVLDGTEVELKYRVTGTGDGSNLELLDSSLHHVDMARIRNYVTEIRHISGGTDEERLRDALGSLQVDGCFPKPGIVYLTDFRTLENNEDLKNSIDELINHDSREQRQKRPIVEALTAFISTLIGKQVIIRFPRSKEIELVLDGGDSMPLSSLGTGLHEIVLLAFYLATSEPSIFCIDEPELHLHPETQRALLRFIFENTNHQYFFSTHSNNFLDPDVNTSIFRVYTAGGKDAQTKIANCDSIQDKRHILVDLGIRASEILQTNGIIWVEGPSDRNYINGWLNLADSTLREGFDYTFQYYGGSVLAGYTLGDDEFKDFIDMLLINRNAYVVMDSDMDSLYRVTSLAPRKRRIIRDSKRADIGYWVTAGREIENYLNAELLNRCYGITVKPEQFKPISEYCEKYDVNRKASESKKIVAMMEPGDIKGVLDLEIKLRELVATIRGWKELSKIDQTL